MTLPLVEVFQSQRADNVKINEEIKLYCEFQLDESMLNAVKELKKGLFPTSLQYWKSWTSGIENVAI